MKKIITILLSITMLMALPMSIYAEDNNQTIDKDHQGDVSVELYASGTSTYSVYLPTKLDVSGASTTLTIKAKGDITPDEKLNIAVTKTGIALKDQATNANKRNDIDLTITGDDGTFTYDQIDDADYDNNSSVTMTITNEGTIPSGNWKTTLPITISLGANA